MKKIAIALCVWSVAAAPSLAAAQAAPPPVNVPSDKVKSLLSQVMAQRPAAPAEDPGSRAPDATLLIQAPRETVALRLDDAIALALENNLDIAVERLVPQTFDLTLAGLRASYTPRLNSTLGETSIVQLPTNQLVGGQRVENNSGTYNVGGTQNVPWGGGSFALTFNNRRQESTSTFNTFNPQYNSTLLAQLTQPLLRNFATDPVRTELRVTALNRDISELELRSTITNTLANVRNGYWDYVYTVELLVVARRTLDLAQKLLEDNIVRVEVGTLAPIDVVQAEAEVATRRSDLAVVEQLHRTAELSLKRLICSGTEDPRWRARLDPTDRPSFQPMPIDVEAALRRALSSRLDLQQSQRTLDANDLNVRLLRNQRLPAADVIASYGLQGIGGTRFVRPEGGIGGDIIDTIPGGYGDALELLRDRSYPNWNVAIELSYPIGSSVADAAYARARLTVRQTQAQVKALELQIATEVANAASLVDSAMKRVEAASAARELAEKRLEAEMSKFDVGRSTNFFVVQAQRDLAQAESDALRARLDYQKSLVDFERVQEASRTRSGISVVTGDVAR